MNLCDFSQDLAFYPHFRSWDPVTIFLIFFHRFEQRQGQASRSVRAGMHALCVRAIIGQAFGPTSSDWANGFDRTLCTTRWNLEQAGRRWQVEKANPAMFILATVNLPT